MKPGGAHGAGVARLLGALAVAAWTTCASAAGVMEPHLEALRAAEQARGNLPGTGVQWTVAASSVQGDKTRSMTLRVVNQGGKVFAEVLEPERSRGIKYLVEDGRMWFYRPALSRPISIPKRQRVTGNAAVGDLASISFLTDYSAVDVSDRRLDGQPCWVFDLRPKSKRAAYASIRYWVSQSARLGLRAEFYSPSGTQLRIATWAYENRLTLAGKEERPFLSWMRVEESTGRAKVTTLRYERVQIRKFPDRLFDPTELGPAPGSRDEERS